MPSSFVPYLARNNWQLSVLCCYRVIQDRTSHLFLWLVYKFPLSSKRMDILRPDAGPNSLQCHFCQCILQTNRYVVCLMRGYHSKWFFFTSLLRLSDQATLFRTRNHPFEVKCVPNGRDFLIAIMCGNMVIDILILALPLFVAYRLDLRKTEKAMLMGLIGLGGFVIICSVMRITCVDPYVTSNDSTWAIMPLVDWTV